MAKHATEEGKRILEDERTARPCPLCGKMVSGRLATCPRCKSRMDAQPGEDAPLTDAFTEDGKLRLSVAARLSGSPEDTEPLPVLSPGPEPPVQADVPDQNTQALAPPLTDQAEAGVTVPLNAPAPDASPSAMVPAIEPEFNAQTPALKRKAKRIAASIAAGIALVAFIAGGVFMANQANALNQITNDLVEADIRADESFTVGSASDAFTTPQPYSIDTVLIDSKEVLEGGVEVRATVRISNGFFDESRKVVVMYQKAEEGWTHTTTVASHTTKPTRGIDHDDEYGISGAEPVFDGTASCQLSIPVEGQSAGSWFATTWGNRIVGYTFENDAWARTNVDDSGLTTSYQGLVGTYASAQQTASQLAYFAISSVDDATGTFTGEFAWKEADGWFSNGRTVQGSFTGSVGADNVLTSASDGNAGQLDFTGSAAGDQTLQLDITLYREAGFFSFSGTPSGNTVSVTLQKQTSEITGWQEPVEEQPNSNTYNNSNGTFGWDSNDQPSSGNAQSLENLHDETEPPQDATNTQEEDPYDLDTWNTQQEDNRERESGNSTTGDSFTDWLLDWGRTGW